MSYNFSYSSIEDVYATAHDETGETKEHLLNLAKDLEQMGAGTFDGVEYVMRDSNYGPEVLSMDDYMSELPVEDEEDNEIFYDEEKDEYFKKDDK